MNTTGLAYLGGIDGRFTTTSRHYERMFKLPSHLEVLMETANTKPSFAVPSLRLSSKEIRPEKEPSDDFKRKISNAQKTLDDCQRQLLECKSEHNQLKRQRTFGGPRASGTSSSMSGSSSNNRQRNFY